MNKLAQEQQSAAILLRNLLSDFNEKKLEKISEGDDPRPDFFYAPKDLFVEVSTITDNADLKRSAQWSDVVYKLQKAIDSDDSRNLIKGSYLIETPDELKTPTETRFFEETAKRIINEILKSAEKVSIAGKELKIIEYRKDGSSILFSTYGRAGSFDPALTIYENIAKKVRKANVQLSYKDERIDATKKILLLVNKYYLLTYDWDLFKAISYLYDELLDYENIGEIWFQVERKDGSFLHKLLYKREFFIEFENGTLDSPTTQDISLFENMFSPIAGMGIKKKEKLLAALKVFLKNKSANEVFKNKVSRSEMVRFGEWLVEEKMYKDAIWLVERFIDDNDPPNPDVVGVTQEELNYHTQILTNKGDFFAISGVLAHLAWIIQKLALQKELVPDAFRFTKKLGEHNNLYVKLQAIIPLIEITKRRKFLLEHDREYGTRLYPEFKDIVFDLLNNYSKYHAMSKWLVHIFNYYRDLNTQEILSVLDKLKNTSESAALFIIFGVFRKNYPTEIEFDANLVEKKLIDIITSDSAEYSDLRSSIAWNFWILLDNEPDKFEEVKKYIQLFFVADYSKNIYASLERIIEDWVDSKPETALEWFDLYIEKLIEYLKNNEGEGRNIWITPEKMVKKIATKDADSLIEVMGKLFEIWKAGAYIGNIADIFISYKYVEDTMTETVRAEFIRIYSEMKKLNPNLEEVSFS